MARLLIAVLSPTLGVLAVAVLLRLPAFADGPRTLHTQATPRPPAMTVPQQPVPGPHPGIGPLPLTHACAPAEVITTKTLVQVQCRTAVQIKGLEEVQVFAIGVDDPNFASRVLRVAMSAQIAGYRLKITFVSSDTSGERVGCPPRTCRLIQTIGLLVN